jgi:MFS transporter, CP family, cyanate transporter
VLTLMGLRARTPESTAALSTATQGAGYLLAGIGPLLVGVLRGITGGYTGLFVLVYLGVALLLAAGWAVCRPRYVDDEVPGLVASPAGTDGADQRRDADVEVAGCEQPVAMPHPRAERRSA